jgi:2-dehydro-3-deoxyphosphooctonate aldolase (KDO 8-P synthase)
VTGRVLDIGSLRLGEGQPLALIAGPCVIESEAHTLFMARSLAEITRAAGVALIFKASFDKANRTSGSSFRGPGLIDGLRILAEVQRQVGVPVTTDIHEPSQAGPAAAVVDLLQIPAFLVRQTDLLVAAGATGRPVNLKKAQHQAAADLGPAAEKVLSAGAPGVMLTERGTTFGYRDLVVDFRNLPAMRALGYPVCFDATHSVQQPGAHGDRSGGQRALAPVLARAAVAVGVDAIFAEVHDRPEDALSDPATQLRLSDLAADLQSWVRLHSALQS